MCKETESGVETEKKVVGKIKYFFKNLFIYVKMLEVRFMQVPLQIIQILESVKLQKV